MTKAVFLDRDGVINIDKGYIHRIEDFEFIPGSLKGLKILKQKGFLLIIVTNQSGIGREYYSEKEYTVLKTEFHNLLSAQGIKITAEYFCPHAPEDICECRKPSPFFIKKAIKEFQIDKTESFFIGDKTSDIQAGKDAGVRTVLVKTGKAGTDKKCKVKPDYVCEDLPAAAELISRL
jgi:D-glycero-D-manno-heptose 1,7-bisphosphate phosphatase